MRLSQNLAQIRVVLRVTALFAYGHWRFVVDDCCCSHYYIYSHCATAAVVVIYSNDFPGNLMSFRFEQWHNKQNNNNNNNKTNAGKKIARWRLYAEWRGKIAQIQNDGTYFVHFACAFVHCLYFFLLCCLRTSGFCLCFWARFFCLFSFLVFYTKYTFICDFSPHR